MITLQWAIIATICSIYSYIFAPSYEIYEKKGQGMTSKSGGALGRAHA